MRCVAWLVVLCLWGCRRTHEPTVNESETRAPATRANEASGVAAGKAGGGDPQNPFGEPVLPPREDRPRMPDGGTINGDPRGPRAADFNAVFNAAMPALRDCFDREALGLGEIPIQMHLVVEPPGYTGDIKVSGAAPKEALDCCRRVLERLEFPPFHGPKIERDLPFTYKKQVPEPVKQKG
jgi:hypothetical protein